MRLIKNIWGNIKEQPVLSAVSLVGTALAVFLIMFVVMLEEVNVAPFAPESNRDRLLYADYGSIYSIENGPDWNSNGGMGTETVKALYKELTTPEAVSVYINYIITSPVSIPGKPSTPADIRGCDAEFFDVFDYTFLSGTPFSASDLESSIKKVVITESLARKTFGKADVVGEEILIARLPYVVSGVVKDVSTLATKAYADAWVPYTTRVEAATKWNTHMGVMSAVILCKDHDDIPVVKEECDKMFDKFNEEIEASGWKMISRERPYDQEMEAAGSYANVVPDVASKRRMLMVLLAVLLIVPAINLSCMTHSRLRQRRAEVGVKRAFGATRTRIIVDILCENMIITLVAGVIGFVMCVAGAYLFSADLFTREFTSLSNAPKIDLSILIHVSTFLWALLFCFLMNIISAGFPAWQASRVNVINAIKG